VDKKDVWDGQRTVSERIVVARQTLLSDGMSATFATENIRSPTDWCFEGTDHTVVVHLEGQLDRMESVFSKGPSSDVLPAVGDIWTIPAGCRYAALAHGDEARFAEFTLPAGLIGQRDLKARVGHRDPFLHQAVLKLAQLAVRPDDLAKMVRDSLLQVVQFHLNDTYLDATRLPEGSRKEQQRQFSNRERNILKGRIADSMDCPQTVAALAELLGLSETSFIRTFKASFGTTPWQYILKMRLERSMKLLASTGISVTEIAVATGFSSPGHFSTAFTRQFGISPSAFRRGGKAR
jgi:AraC family transcriptional regulator